MMNTDRGGKMFEFIDCNTFFFGELCVRVIT